MRDSQGGGDRVTLNLPGHPTSVTQCYLAMNNALRVIYPFA